VDGYADGVPRVRDEAERPALVRVRADGTSLTADSVLAKRAIGVMYADDRPGASHGTHAR
jgi:hypothetical protein